MLYRLLINYKGCWKQIDGGNDYGKLLNTAMGFDDNTEWMIVELKRYHSGAAETETIST